MQTQYATTQTNHLSLSVGLLVDFPFQICVFCYFSHNHQQWLMRKPAQTGQLDLVKCGCRIKRFSNYFNLNIGWQNCFQHYKIVQIFVASLEAWPPPYDVDLEAAVRWPVRQVALSNDEVGLTCAFAGLFLSSVRAYVQPSQSDLQISSFSSCLCWRWAGQKNSDVVELLG